MNLFLHLSYPLNEYFIRDPDPFNTLTINVPQYIETIQLISSANQLTGYYMMGKTDR